MQGKFSYFSEDTIAAIATGSGGALTIVRVSGPSAIDVLKKIAKFHQSPRPRHMYRAQFHTGSGAIIDDGLFVFFRGPRSLTGEDVVEFYLHGGSFLSYRFMEEILASGARQALPGEFSFRAVRNGKASLSQVEAIPDLLAASNDTALSMALEKMAGSEGGALERLGEELRQLAVLSEAGIDFSDQHLDEVALPVLQKRALGALDELLRLRDSFKKGVALQDGVPVALIGAPNAGKSSLFNALLGEDRSIVSEIPGTTRDVVREKITLRTKDNSLTFRAHDTAGLRKEGDPVERIGVERSLKAAEEADLLLIVVDLTQPSESVEPYWNECKAKGWDSKTIGVFTKLDLLESEDIERIDWIAHSLGLREWVMTSVKSNVGISDLAEKMVEFCGQWIHRKPNEILLTRLDHFDAVAGACAHLERAMKATSEDLFAADINQALAALNPLIGETLSEDILSRIFSKFCIGK